MKTVALITGAAGFIGSHLAERLLRLGYRVVGIDNFDDCYPEAIKRGNIHGFEGDGGFQLIDGDVRDSLLLARVFADHDINVVAHLAGRAGVRPSLEQPLLYQDVNIGGTINLLEASRSNHVRKFIYASSSSVYGNSQDVPFREDAQVEYPLSPYAASKAAAELFCCTYSHLYNLPVVVLRFFTVYGPRQRPEMAIHRFVRMVDGGETVTLFGDGSSSRDYTYVEDIVSGLEASLRYEDDVFQIFNLGGGRTVSLIELIKVIEDALGKKAEIEYVPPPPGEVPITAADITKAQAILDYKPLTTIEEGVRRFVDWYLENKAGVTA